MTLGARVWVALTILVQLLTQPLKLTLSWHWCCSCKPPWYLGKDWSQPDYCQIKAPHSHPSIRRCTMLWTSKVEAFKASNKAFHQCNVLSNHHALSHDVAVTMACMERLKYIISGGWWWDSTTKSHTQACKHIIKDFSSNQLLQSYLGWMQHQQHSLGNSLTALNSHILTLHWHWVQSSLCWEQNNQVTTLGTHFSVGFLWCIQAG